MRRSCLGSTVRQRVALRGELCDETIHRALHFARGLFGALARLAVPRSVTRELIEPRAGLLQGGMFVAQSRREAGELVVGSERTRPPEELPAPALDHRH